MTGKLCPPCADVPGAPQTRQFDRDDPWRPRLDNGPGNRHSRLEQVGQGDIRPDHGLSGHPAKRVGPRREERDAFKAQQVGGPGGGPRNPPRSPSASVSAAAAAAAARRGSGLQGRPQPGRPGSAVPSRRVPPRIYDPPGSPADREWASQVSIVVSWVNGSDPDYQKLREQHGGQKMVGTSRDRTVGWVSKCCGLYGLHDSIVNRGGTEEAPLEQPYSCQWAVYDVIDREHVWTVHADSCIDEPHGHALREGLGTLCFCLHTRELLHAFRCIERFMPWHKGTIFLVTPGQTPTWLNTSHPRVKVIDQVSPQLPLQT